MAISFNLNTYNKWNNSASLMSSMFGNSSTGVTNTNFGGVSYSDMSSALLGTINRNDAATQVADSIKSYATDVKESGEKIKASIMSLTGKNAKDKNATSLFSQVTAKSSDTSILTVKADANKTQMTNNPMEVKISQIATAQRNSATVGTARSVDIGTYAFSIQKDGKEYNYSINVTAKDSNSTIQEKIAEKINKDKNIGLTASVSTDSKNGKTTLNVESDKTGTGSSGDTVFEFTDTNGELTAALGLNNVQTYAQNAVYSVNNGDLQVSKSNDVDLGNGITATLKKASSSAATIGLNKNTSGAVDAIKELVTNFNSLLSKSRTYAESDYGAERLLTELSGVTKTYDKTLEKLGISVDSSGYMTIDSGKLTTAAENGTLQKLFINDSGGYASFGFGARMQQVAERISDNPTNYMSQSSKQIYTDTTTKFGNAYNKYAMTGMLFDGLI